MQSYSCALCVLILLVTTFSTGSESAFHPVKVKFNETATLPCSERCSGLVRWTVFSNPSDIVAECNQTSCRSVKEGYQMIHHQYLNGDLSLTITDADFSKRNGYTCDCDGKEICDVVLKLEPLNTTLQVTVGESLVLDLDIPDAVEVRYNSTGASTGQICTVNGRSAQCEPEYSAAVSVISALELKEMKPSHNGVYTVWDTRNEEVIHTYTVTVQGAGSEADRQIDKLSRIRRSATPDRQPCLCGDLGPVVPQWVAALLGVLVVVFSVVIVVLFVVIIQLRRKIPKGCKANEVMKTPNGAEMKELEQQQLAPPQ